MNRPQFITLRLFEQRTLELTTHLIPYPLSSATQRNIRGTRALWCPYGKLLIEATRLTGSWHPAGSHDWLVPDGIAEV